MIELFVICCDKCYIDYTKKNILKKMKMRSQSYANFFTFLVYFFLMYSLY